jgi:hypothetical protein
MAKKNVIIEEPEVDTPVVEETVVEETVVETPAVETKPWEGYPSRDFFTPIEGVTNGRLADGGQEEA